MELNLKKQKSFLELTNLWEKFFYENSPMGRLIKKNSYEKIFKKNPIQILHLTPFLEDIKKDKIIYSSGGGLGSVVYGSPLNLDTSPHNIYNLYKEFQLPINFKKDKIKTILIRIRPLCNPKNITSWKVDYTLFGKIHCKVWRELKKCLVSKGEYFNSTEKDIESRIRNNLEMINLLISPNFEEIDQANFNKIYKKIFTEFPELRFIIYEVLAEYILFFQNNKKALFYLSKNEIYNLNHKKFIQDLCPTMLKKFKMKKFFIEQEDIVKYLKKRTIIKDFDKNSFLDFFKKRISYYFLKICKKNIIGKNFCGYYLNHPYFVGQIIYRKFYDKKLFEKYRSKYLYKIWDKKKILVPIYSIVPKGEVGINPNLDKMKIPYEIYEVKIEKGKIKILNKLDVGISPENISDKFCAIR